MPLKILAKSTDPTSMTLTLEGSLDAVTSPELDQFFSTRVGAFVRTVVLDLARLSFISSAGLRIFAKMRKTLQARSGSVCFVNLSPQVKKVFEIVKVIPQTALFGTDAELDAYLATMQRKVTEEP